MTLTRYGRTTDVTVFADRVRRVSNRTASLAKAFGGRAGVIACSQRIADFLPFHSLGAIFSSILLPRDIGALEAVLDLVLARGRRERDPGPGPHGEHRGQLGSAAGTGP